LAAQRGQPIAAAAGLSDDQHVGNGDAAPLADGEGSFDKGAYFIGKAVWGKGYGTLLQRMKEAKDAGSSFHLDCFGSGEDEDEVPCIACAKYVIVYLRDPHLCQLLCCRDVSPLPADQSTRCRAMP
jgi:hypothetical protein